MLLFGRVSHGGAEEDWKGGRLDYWNEGGDGWGRRCDEVADVMAFPQTFFIRDNSVVVCWKSITSATSSPDR